jgi:DNA-binding GntR family transcriptional regulator
MPVPRTPDPVPAQPLRRQEVERRLGDAIIRGELEPGERLPEDELAAWLGVSRTPVREALSRLAAAGLVVIDANRGARVAPLDPAEMLDLAQVSRGLVLLAQRLAAERATDVELRAMRELHEARAAAMRALDQAAVERAALGFHLAILAASRNHELQRMIPMIFPRLERVFRFAYPEWLREAGVEVDGELLEALEAHDPSAVERASGRGWDAIESRLRSRAGPFAAPAGRQVAEVGAPDGAPAFEQEPAAAPA